MSDSQQGPGWWQASDGKWYAPEVHPDHRSPGGQQTANRPFFVRHWILTTVVVLFALLVLLAIVLPKPKKTTTVGVSHAATTQRRNAPTTIKLVPAPPKTTAKPTTTTTATPSTTVAPTLPPPTQPLAPPPTAAPVALCGAPANPMGYNLCHRGSLIYQPDASTCSYFNCVNNFGNGTGYMEECSDGTYSMSGGHRGACSSHGGELLPVSSGP